MFVEVLELIFNCLSFISFSLIENWNGFLLLLLNDLKNRINTKRGNQIPVIIKMLFSAYICVHFIIFFLTLNLSVERKKIQIISHRNFNVMEIYINWQKQFSHHFVVVVHSAVESKQICIFYIRNCVTTLYAIWKHMTPNDANRITHVFYFNRLKYRNRKKTAIQPKKKSLPIKKGTVITRKHLPVSLILWFHDFELDVVDIFNEIKNIYTNK